MKKYIVPTLWLIGAFGWIEMAWNYHIQGRMEFACLQIIIAILFLIRAVKGYVKILIKEIKENEKN